MSILRDGHWITEHYSQRITIKQWKEILLNENDKIIVHGRSRRIVGKNIGAGVVEVRKAKGDNND